MNAFEKLSSKEITTVVQNQFEWRKKTKIHSPAKLLNRPNTALLIPLTLRPL